MSDYISRHTGQEIDAGIDRTRTNQSSIESLDARVDELEGAMPGKVDKVSGKGLSTNDYTTAEKTKLGALPTNESLQATLSTFITRSVDNLVNYYLKSETYTKTEVQNLIAAINQFHYEVYPSTSAVTNPQSNVLYLIGPTGSGSDKYEEYVYSNGWVKIGDTSIDLSGYVTTDALNTALQQVNTAIAAKYTKPSGGIPKTDLSNDVQTSLGKADSAIQDVSDKADKDTDAVEGNIAKFDDNGNPVDSGTSVDNIAQIDGFYEQMGVGTAKNLEGRSDVTDSFLERTTGGDAEVANGLAQIAEVKGKSQAWNQLVQNGNFADGRTGWAANGATLAAADGILTWTANNATTSNNLQKSIPFINDHKYYICFFIKGNADNTIGGAFGSSTGGGAFSSEAYTTSWKHIAKMATPTTNTVASLYLRPNLKGNENAVVDFKNIYLIDLTLLGIDSLTTVEEVEAWLAKNIGLKPYYPYNAGTVLNAKMKGIESLGFNLLDPTTGKARIVGAYSDVYGNYYGITGTHGTLTFTSDLGEVSEITPDSDGKFLLETPGWLDVATPGADCAVFLWWDGTRTEFEEYDREVANLDVTHIYGKLNGTGERVQIFPDGMAGIGSVKDVVRVEDGVTVAKKRIGVVDMGTLTYVYLSSSNAFINNIAQKVNGGNVLTSKYVFGGIKGSQATILSSPDKSVYGQPNNKNIFVKDSAYTGDTTGEAALKSDLSGVMLYFELATEQVYTDLVYQGSDLFADGTPVTLPVPYIVNNWGLERVIPQNPAEGPITSAPEISIKYGVDAVEQLDTIRTSGVFVEDLKANLQALLAVINDKLETAMGGTIAIGATPTDKVYPFTFIPTPEPEPTNEGE